MNRLIKEVEFGKYSFKVAINREIALKVAEEFPDFIGELLQAGEDMPDLQTAIKNKKFKEMIERTEYILKGSKEVVKFALPYMLQEAEEKNIDVEELFEYAEKNEADDLLAQNLWEFILLGFTNNGGIKTPKIAFKMR